MEQSPFTFLTASSAKMLPHYSKFPCAFYSIGQNSEITVPKPPWPKLSTTREKQFPTLFGQISLSLFFLISNSLIQEIWKMQKD